MKVAGEDKLVFLVELHLKSSSMILMKATKKQLRFEVVFVQPYASDAVDYLRPYFTKLYSIMFKSLLNQCF